MADVDPRLELIRRGWVAYNAGDIEGNLAVLDPDVEVYASPAMMNSGRFHGHDGFRRWGQVWEEAWASAEYTVAGMDLVGERHVVVTIRQTAVGRESGIPVEQESQWVYEARDGLCVYMAIYLDHEEALADARSREAED